MKKTIIQNSVIFDIETVGAYKTFQDLQKADPHLADLWIKRCKWLGKKEDVETESPEELWISKSALHPEFGKIVCASFGLYENPVNKHERKHTHHRSPRSGYVVDFSYSGRFKNHLFFLPFQSSTGFPRVFPKLGGIQMVRDKWSLGDRAK